MLEFICNDPPGTGSGSGTAAFEGTVRLSVYGSGSLVATYEKGRRSWNCLGDNVMYLASNTAACSSWPATITLVRNADTPACLCSCGTQPVRTYELIIGSLTAGTGSTSDCDPTDCGCDVRYTRICLSGSVCSARGAWYADTNLLGMNFLGDDGSLYPYLSPTPGGCAPIFNSQRWNSGNGYANLVYENYTDMMVLTLVDNTGTLATYKLAAASFDSLGNNTFTYISGSYTHCVLPSTVEVNFHSTDPMDCISNFDCDICSNTTVMPSGWTFTISGVTGPPHVLTRPDGVAVSRNPCEAINGTYCLGKQSTSLCNYTILQGFAPDPILYYTWTVPALSGPATTYSVEASASAFMYISGGMVAIQILLYIPGLCRTSYLYEIPTNEFLCDADNILTLKCGAATDLLYGSDASDGSCACTSVPSTITISPTDNCGSPPAACACFPKASYSPRVLITNILEGSCEECACYGTLDICFLPTGSTSTCTWRADFTIPDGITSCRTPATYALLNIGVAPNDGFVVVSLYDASDNLLAEYHKSITYFSCGSPITLDWTDGTDVCAWLGAIVSLDMLGVACPSCAPCDSDFSQYTVTVTYNGTEYSTCATSIGSCEYLSPTFTMEREYFYVKLQFGPNPTSYARVLLYLSSGLLSGTGSGTSPADILIGVYNWLFDESLYVCADAETLFLATGNEDQCGEFVDVTGFTDRLGSDATVLGNCGCAVSSITYSSASSFSYPTIAGCIYQFETWGGGGGGHGGTGGNRSDGGGGGGYSLQQWTSDGSTLTITVGVGGTGGTGDGTAGGDSSVGTLCIAKGGTGGTSVAVGVGGQASAGTGTTKFSGGSGGTGSADDQGGGGGGSAGPSNNGNNGQDGDLAFPLAAAGGAAVTGGGAGGDGGLTSVGLPGSAPGGAGGGGDQSSGTAGGAGAAGQVRVQVIG